MKSRASSDDAGIAIFSANWQDTSVATYGSSNGTGALQGRVAGIEPGNGRVPRLTSLHAAAAGWPRASGIRAMPDILLRTAGWGC
jgi:hypothetical protein